MKSTSYGLTLKTIFLPNTLLRTSNSRDAFDIAKGRLEILIQAIARETIPGIKDNTTISEIAF